MSAVALEHVAAVTPARSKRSFGSRLARNKLAVVGVVLAGALVAIALFAPVIARHDPTAIDAANRLLPPSGQYPFGTDDQGRDVFSRVVYGTRLSLLAAAVVLAISVSVGSVVGLAAGYFGGVVDEVLMRLTDMFLAFPALVLAMGVAAALGANLFNAMVAIAVVWWPWYARLVRGQTLRLREEAFVEAARATGATDAQILRRHILPNCSTPIVVQMTLDVGYAILTTAGLSFIGLGAQPPTPEWGSMVATGKDFILDQWWFATFPGLAILIAVMAFNVLGDGLQEAMNPGSNRR